MKNEKRRKFVNCILYYIVMVLIGIGIGGMISVCGEKIFSEDVKLENQLIKQEGAGVVSDEKEESIVEAEEQEKELIEILIAEHSINNVVSSDNRNHNMQTAALIINGTTDGYILEPGQTFSWLAIVGNTTAEKGFKTAPVLINSIAQDGLGGGVCQVSTTINTAVLKTGIETKACKHSKKVSYLSESDAEATVSYDAGIDFSFQNTLAHPIKIKVETEGGMVTVKIFKIVRCQKEEGQNDLPILMTKKQIKNTKKVLTSKNKSAKIKNVDWRKKSTKIIKKAYGKATKKIF